MKKLGKKKHSLDLTTYFLKPQKKPNLTFDRMKKKSNNNSVSSNVVISMVSTQRKKPSPRQKKIPLTSRTQKKQKQLNKLLENFQYGSIDKNAITKEIIRMFDQKNVTEEAKKKTLKIQTKNGTTSANPSTPKNTQISRLNSFVNNNIKNIHQHRKKQCLSSRSSFPKSKSVVVHKKEFIEGLVDIKAIDSSLFLSERQQENVILSDRVFGIQTSDSVADLAEQLKQQRKSFSVKRSTNQFKELMAIKIQRAWRQYKTKKLIETLLVPSSSQGKQQQEKLNILLQKLDQSPIVSQKSSPSEKYQSQEIMANKAAIFDAERVKGQILRTHELQKWNQIMQYVKMNMQNKELSSDQCLNRIIDYFQNVKTTVEKQLSLVSEKNKQQNERNDPALTQFTNQISKQNGSPQLKFEEMVFSQEESSESILQIADGSDIEIIDEKQEKKQSKYTFNLENLGSKYIGSKTITFQTIEHGLQSYSKKLQAQRQQEVDELDIYSRDYLKQKDKIDKKYNDTKKQLKKIIKNLNRGYEEVKTILNKSLNEEQSKVTRCKSDDYLLRTAINYKEYVENMGSQKQQKNSKTDKEENNSQHIHSVLSIDMSEDKLYGFGKLDDKIMSEQLLQYEELEKKFQDDSDDHAQSQAEEISLFDNNRLNQKSKKLQFICSEDKEDIFEFIFIDLLLEIKTQMKRSPSILSFFEKHKDRINRLRSIPRGVKTNLPACKEYLNNLQQHIRKNHMEMYFRHIEVPMGPSAIEMLKYMHENDDDSNDEDSEMIPLILPVFVFEGYEEVRQYKFDRFYDEEEKQSSRIKFLKSVDHIHSKAVFDCLNEWLDNERPFGIWGKPFPWKKVVKNDMLSLQKKQRKFAKALDRTVQCCSYLCGILVDKQQSLFAHYKISQHYIDQIREDRMSKMLSNELLQNEQRWVFYDDEQTEVMIEMTKYITKRILEEATWEISRII